MLPAVVIPSERLKSLEVWRRLSLVVWYKFRSQVSSRVPKSSQSNHQPLLVLSLLPTAFAKSEEVSDSLNGSRAQFVQSWAPPLARPELECRICKLVLLKWVWFWISFSIIHVQGMNEKYAPSPAETVSLPTTEIKFPFLLLAFSHGNKLFNYMPGCRLAAQMNDSHPFFLGKTHFCKTIRWYPRAIWWCPGKVSRQDLLF